MCLIYFLEVLDNSVVLIQTIRLVSMHQMLSCCSIGLYLVYPLGMV